MFGLGKLIALPIDIVNAPLRAMEMLVDSYDNGPPTEEKDRVVSTPLRILADAVEEAIDGRE